MGADAFPDTVIGIKGLGIRIGACAGDDVWGSWGQGASPCQEGFPAEEDGLGALSLPCQGTAWLLTAPAPLALLFLGTLMHSSLVPSSAERCLWAASLRDGQCGIGRDGRQEFLPCSPSRPGTALPAILPLIFDPSLPSSPESARSRGRKRSLLPDG